MANIWLDDEKDSSIGNVTNIFNESVGQMNQTMNGGSIIEPQQITKQSSKTSLLNKAFWVFGIIGILTAIYEFVIKHFF